jgi:aminoglycoside 2'-N-acetyltransferase I
VALRVARTADPAPAELAAARALLDDVFGSEMTDADWRHALGGVHALACDGAELVGHAAVVRRRLHHRGRVLAAGYVEGVAVRADRRRRGVGTALLRELEVAIRGECELGALGATDEAAPFYAALGWRRWRGPTSVLALEGPRRTPDDDGAVWVLPVACELDLDGELTCDWRDGDVW